MSSQTKPGNLAHYLAKAFREFAKTAGDADQTIAHHMAAQLEKEDAIVRIELHHGDLKLESPPMRHVVKRKVKHQKPTKAPK